MADSLVPDGIELIVSAGVEDGPGPDWGSLSHGESIPHSWADIQRSIERLDGVKYNEVDLRRAGYGHDRLGEPGSIRGAIDISAAGPGVDARPGRGRLGARRGGQRLDRLGGRSPSRAEAGLLTVRVSCGSADARRLPRRPVGISVSCRRRAPRRCCDGRCSGR